MKKIILSVFAISSLVLPTFLLALNQSVYACPDEEPATLLSLYKDSEFIHRARFTGEVVGEPQPEGEGYSVAEVSRNFDVFATHKGRSVEKVTLYHSKYIYDQQPETVVDMPATAPNEHDEPGNEPENSHSEEQPEGENEEEPIKLKPGDEVLLFLRKGEEGNRLELTDYSGGAKRLSREDMAVYEARIKDLNTLFASKKPSAAKIVDWLIKCADEPATRWEGTYQLDKSFNDLEYKKAREAEEKDKKKSAVSQESKEPEDPEMEESTHEYAEAMTQSHQQELTDLFTRSVRADTSRANQTEAIRGDYQLMSLVTRWADDRIAIVMADKLRGGGYEPWDSHQMMSSITKILKDGKLEELAAEFEENLYRGDDETIEPHSDRPKASVETQKPENEDSTSPETSTADQKAEKTPANYGELRADITERFLARAEQVVLAKQSAAKAVAAKE